MIDQQYDDDCLVCCLSHVLGIPYSDIPNFVRKYEAGWRQEMDLWLEGFHSIECIAFDGWYPRKGVYMVDGFTERGTPHIVVYSGRDMVMDPHRSRAGLSEIRRTYWLMPLSPHVA
jgi:hypothetical protein